MKGYDQAVRRLYTCFDLKILYIQQALLKRLERKQSHLASSCQGQELCQLPLEPLAADGGLSTQVLFPMAEHLGLVHVDISITQCSVAS